MGKGISDYIRATVPGFATCRSGQRRVRGTPGGRQKTRHGCSPKEQHGQDYLVRSFCQFLCLAGTTEQNCRLLGSATCTDDLCKSVTRLEWNEELRIVARRVSVLPQIWQFTACSRGVPTRRRTHPQSTWQPPDRNPPVLDVPRPASEARPPKTST